MENVNTIIDFARYVKGVFDYLIKGEGEKPQIDLQECNNFSNVLNFVTSDQKGKMSIGAVSKVERGNVFNNCVFNFGDGNSAQNQLHKEMCTLQEECQENDIYERVLMQIYQLRSDADTNIGNKAVIDEIFKGKHLPVVFNSEELKNNILFLDANPTRKAYQVDVKVQTLSGRPKAYKVMALHDVIDLEVE